MENNILKDTKDHYNVDYYMSLPYSRIVYPVNDESGKYYVGRILEFDGCMTTGESSEEVFSLLEEAMEGWISVKLEHKDPIPEPVDTENYSGKFVLRLPVSLHKKLAVEAKVEGISLNQYIMYKLAQ